MNLLSVGHFQTVDPPWVQLLVLEQGQLVELEKELCQIPDFIVRIIDSSKCTNSRELFSEFARVLKFPAYFGTNWAALDECITDLEWMPGKGYVLLIKNADQFLINGSQDDYASFVRIMKKAGEEWSIQQVGEWPRDPTPFHVLLIVSDDKRQSRAEWAIPEASLEAGR